MFGQLLPEQASAPDSATVYGFAGPMTGTLPPLLSHQLMPNLRHPINGPYLEHSFGGRALTQVTPQSILNRVAIDAVARNGCAGILRMR